jgi:hypothetical protein
MLDPLFVEAWTHAPAGHTVLGRSLHPFSALDLLALQVIDSPFSKEESMCEVHDLLIAVWICSNPHADTLTVENLELGNEGQKWLAAIMPSVDMERDVKSMLQYVHDYFSPPELLRHLKSSPVTGLGAPWILTTVVSVCRTLHIPLREAWTMGIGQLLWYRCSIEEQDSPDSRIIGPEMRALMAQAEQGSKVHELKPGESLDDFCARTGISSSDAAIFLHNNTEAKN